MANNIIKNKIQQAIKDFAENNLTKSAINLFQTLGYNTDRQAPLSQKNFNEFKEDYIDQDKNFNEEKALCPEWTFVDLLFQLSKEEILKQSSLFDTKQVDNTIIETYLFFSIELSQKNYSRSALSNITREINKLFPMPVMILFKHGNTLTLSVINRRLHKRDATKDVLEKVTQIKDINIEKPHRAHIEILFDLSFDELQHKYSFTNFVELHNAWQKNLDIQELNKRFFNELANWYFWATTQVAFPDDEIKDQNTRNATGVIRLITRLMFVWFLKEKNLVPDELFDQRILKSILKFSDNKKSTFYKAILQNLFFATLNTEMGKRKFRSKQEQNRNGHYFIHNVFRYEDEFIEPIKTLETYFDPIPFLNGGLFECLDKQIEEKGKLKSIRIDGFSDRNDNVLKVDDALFFGEEKTVDLTVFYDPKSKRKQHYKVRGLIHILNSYKFTITENTPIDEEIALDPELLGKVFENLLANYNPETKTTARKQTGSFYTPREIVNYMVDESIIAYLKQQLDEENDTEEKLRNLLSYSEKELDFSDDQKDKLINAIDDVKILDPACGSGAFPMGVLHKLVHILHKIDPKNQKWEQRQLNKVDKLITEAEEITDTKTRNSVITDLQKNRGGIIEAFDKNELDYGRKLFLIENCIYGVDIQAIASQISKLRFFISLIVDQRTDDKKENLGIRPLPNLETKFVAANTLIELEKENGNLFTNPEIEIKKTELKKVRHKYFEARTPKTKEKCRQDDKRLRNELADILTKDQYLQPEAAKKLAAWDPYDQNASASFFDPEWMFGFSPEFNIVIGNPPYVRVQQLSHSEIDYFKSKYDFAHKRLDISLLFFEKGLKILSNSGILCYISSNQFLVTEYGGKARVNLKQKKIHKILDFGDYQVFESALTYTSVFIIFNDQSKEPFRYKKILSLDDIVSFETQSEIIEKTSLGSSYWVLDSQKNTNILGSIKNKSSKLDNIATTHYGIITGNDSVLILDNKDISINQIEKEALRQIVFPENITKWTVNNPEYYVIYPYTLASGKTKILSMQEIRKQYENLADYLNENKTALKSRKDSRKTFAERDDWYGLVRFSTIEIFNEPKIITPTIVKQNKFAIDKNRLAFAGGKTTVITTNSISLECLLGILNSKVIEFFLHTICPVKAGGYFNYSTTFLREIPIKDKILKNKILQDKISLLSKYIIYTNKISISQFFERLLDAILYELYLTNVIESANAEVLKHLSNLSELTEFDYVKNTKLIEKVHKELSNPHHPVSLAIFKMDTIEEIRIIEGKQ